MLNDKEVQDSFWFGFPLLKQSFFDVELGIADISMGINETLESTLNDFVRERIDLKKKL